MINDLSRPKPRSRRLTLVAAMALVTLAAFALAWQARHRVPDFPPLRLEELTDFGFDPYMIGYLFQSLVIPLALIYLISNTKVFRRAVVGEAVPGDSLKLFGLLVLIQALVIGYELGRPLFWGGAEPAPATVGLLVVVTAGLLGGWRMGLAIGLVALVLRGSLQMITMVDFGLWGEIAFLYGEGGLVHVLRYFPWRHILFDFFLYNLWTSAAVWAGVVAGLWAELLGERRFAPLNALLLGVGIDLVTVYLTTIAGVPPGVLFLIPNLLVSGVSMAAVALIVRSVQAESSRRRAETAELARAQAELRALRAQINPHFLFNALNTIRYFVRTDPDTARRLLLDLSEVFQRALRSGESIPLEDELSYVEAYLSLEKARLDQRLQVQWSLPHKGQDGRSPLFEQPVPTLILQPIVENAIVHGIAKKPNGGMVRITAEQAARDLVLRVEDDGPGISADRLAEVLSPVPGRDASDSARGRPSIGLRNVDGRLRALYGEEYRLLVESEAGRGTSVQIRVPIEG